MTSSAKVRVADATRRILSLTLLSKDRSRKSSKIEGTRDRDRIVIKKTCCTSRRKRRVANSRGDVCALDLPSLTILPAIVATIRDEKLHMHELRCPVSKYYPFMISRQPDDATHHVLVPIVHSNQVERPRNQRQPVFLVLHLSEGT